MTQTTRRGPPDLPLSQLSLRIAAELERLLALSLAVQTALSHCIPVSSNDVETLRQLQGIDRISQSLADLANLMPAFAVATPETAVLHRLTLDTRLTLHDLRQRLARPAPGGAQAESSDTGEVMLF